MKNHRLIFLLFIITLSINSVKAQDLNLGLKGGLNYSKTIAPGDDPFSPRTSFHAGVFAEIPLRGRFSFHPEIIYSSQGTKIKFARLENFDQSFVNQNNEVFVAKADFVLIPLITRFNFNEFISLEIGPQIGFLVSEGSFIDYGPTLGVGFALPKNFKVQLRSYLGISDIFRESFFEDEKLSDKTYYALLQLSVGYAIF